MKMQSGAATALLGLALVLGGCGEPSLEQQLEAREAALADSRSAVEEARERLREREQKLVSAQEGVDEAREQLREAEAALAEAETKLATPLDDDVLFRVVQARLLEADALGQAAIRAEVQGGVVVLHGTVELAETRDRAVEVADAVPGVERVDSRIVVRAGDGP